MAQLDARFSCVERTGLWPKSIAAMRFAANRGIKPFLELKLARRLNSHACMFVRRPLADIY